MTFRLRLIITTTVAVAFAVLLACTASFFSTRNAVLRSVDESLYAAARGPHGNAGEGRPGEGESVAGVSFQIVLASGAAYPDADLPVDATVLKVANQKSGTTLRTIYVKGNAYRELLVPIRAGTTLQCGAQPCVIPTNAAQVFSVNITGQQHQLHVLEYTLLVLALLGVILAVMLGYLAATAALGPLEDVTNEIEGVAETSNVAHRLVEGRNDELGRLRRVFNQLLASVDQSQRLQRQLVLDASHELRTPLTSLRTNAQVLAHADRLTNDELQQITTDMVAQVDELAALITDLGELARGEGIDGTTESLRWDDLVDEVVDVARTHARTRGVTIEATLSPTTVEGRRDRLTRAVNNLITNAIKFSPENGSVVVTLESGVLRVEDNGPGVAVEDRPFVFDRFWRSARSRGLPGSGLGLAIVNQVADEMGGTVTVDSSTSLGGAMFTLTLPTINEES